MKILFTGERGCGKSTLIYEIFKNYDCGGVVCIPVFKKDKIIGKDAVDMADKSKKIFCRIHEEADFYGIKTENYVINEDGINFCINALEKAFDKNLVIVDEFGFLEKKGEGIYSITEKLIKSEKNLIVIVRKEIEEYFLKKFPYEFKRIYME
ncbi:MAG TPA: DUF2478 domain-containing protein [Thermoplasmata archaeon]|nr:DUF2478 domain-containing protein [Thermoplasmata archaeon]